MASALGSWGWLRPWDLGVGPLGRPWVALGSPLGRPWVALGRAAAFLVLGLGLGRAWCWGWVKVKVTHCGNWRARGVKSGQETLTPQAGGFPIEMIRMESPEYQRKSLRLYLTCLAQGKKANDDCGRAAANCFFFIFVFLTMDVCAPCTQNLWVQGGCVQGGGFQF